MPSILWLTVGAHAVRGCSTTDLNATVAGKGRFQESHSNAAVADVMPS